MNDLPRYKLTRAAYCAPRPGAPLRVMDAGATVLLEGSPGFHMEPDNDAAHAVVKKMGKRSSADPEKAAVEALATTRFDPNGPGLAG